MQQQDRDIRATIERAIAMRQPVIDRMRLSIDYYNYEHAIAHKERTAIGERGKPQKIYNLPNYRIIDNQYAKVVDQKVNYLFQQAPIVKGDHPEPLQDFFTQQFVRTLAKVALESYLCGIAWLYVYRDGGKTKVKKMDTTEITPIWEDNDHERLKCIIRKYRDEAQEIVEIYTREGVQRYDNTGGKWAQLPDGANAFQGKIPFIYFKANVQEMPLLEKVKSLQDAINLILSTYMDRMMEDSRSTIIVIRNYDGEDLGEFRQQLAQYGAVKVRDADGSGGGIDTLEVKVDAQNYEFILRILKEKLIENARGIDAKNDRAQTPNQLNIKSMYADIELDANAIELEFSASLAYLEEFLGVMTPSVVKFKRNIMINEEAAINMAAASMGIVSRETVLEHHPFVEDVSEEIKRLDAETEAYEGEDHEHEEDTAE